VDNSFAPKYLTIKGKGDIIKELKSAVKSAGEVIWRPTPIARVKRLRGTLAQLLKTRPTPAHQAQRDTKEAALAALKDAQPIDMDLVNASKRGGSSIVSSAINFALLWAKVGGGLSAGRVQSVAVKLIVDREREIARV